MQSALATSPSSFALVTRLVKYLQQRQALAKCFFRVCVCFVKDQAMLWTVIVQGEVEAVLCQSSGQGSTPGCDTDRGWVKNNLSVLHSQPLCRLLNVCLAFMGTEVIAHIKLFTFP